MKYRIEDIVILFGCLLLFSCEKKVTRDFPRVITEEVNVLDTGVVFRGSILNLNDVSVEDYGFLFGEGEFDESSETYMISVVNEQDAESFEVRIGNGLIKGRSYYCMAYAESASYLSIGQLVNFISKGSELPALVDFYPKTGFAGTPVTIVCSNIFGDAENYRVRFNGTEADILSINQSEIKVIAPGNINKEFATIEVSAYGGYSSFTTPFRFQFVEITSVSPLEVYPGQEISIRGKLPSDVGYLEVLFNDIPASIMYYSDSLLKIRAPFPKDSLNFISINSGLTLELPDTIRYIFPFTNHVSPSTGMPDDLITVRGRGIGINRPWNATIGGHWANILGVEDDQLILRVPPEDFGCDSEIKLFYSEPPGVLICSDMFNLNQPKISSINSVILHSGNDLVIEGISFLKDRSPSVISIGDSLFTPYWQGYHSISVTIPENFPTGKYTVGVANCNSFFLYQDSIIIQ